MTTEYSCFEEIMEKRCLHPKHFPPEVYVPQNKRYKHVCIGCGNIIYVYPTAITYGNANGSIRY